MRLFRLIAVCLAFLATAPALAQAPLPKGVTKAHSVEGITEYRLENGRKVLLFPDVSKPTVTVNVPSSTIRKASSGDECSDSSSAASKANRVRWPPAARASARLDTP